MFNAKTQTFSADHWEQIGHFYAPISYYKGAVLKYQGIVTKGNQGMLKEQFPDGLMLDSYIADRITAADHTPYTQF